MATMGTAARGLSLTAHFGANKHANALATLYWALFKGDPFGAGTEPGAAGNYSRAATSNTSALWGTISATATNVTTASAVAWPVATGAYSITGPFDYFAIFDSPSGGVLWYGGPLTTTIPTPASGDQPRLPIGTVIFNQQAG